MKTALYEFGYVFIFYLDPILSRNFVILSRLIIIIGPITRYIVFDEFVYYGLVVANLQGPSVCLVSPYFKGS